MSDLTREQAKKLLEQGLMLTHTSFTRNEWVKGLGNGTYEFEDGCRCDAEEFWLIRHESVFNDGWRVKSERGLTFVNVGTIGHVDFGKSTLQAAINGALPRKNKSDRKRDKRRRWG